MKSSQRWVSGFGTVALTSTAIASALTLAEAAPAKAQAAYGSYIGVGVAVGLTEDNDGDGDNFSGVIAGRYRLLESPISIRGQALLFGDSSAFVPTVSYDFPLNWQTDAYVGAGVSFVADGDEPSPVGDQTAFVIQPGIDYALPNSNMVVFGNAIIAFDAYRDGGGAALSLQGGVGFQF
ncbi:outer membrane beta-barrel protein [Almyronema epifaneia]|uniref:Outer membrane beta-barrel protein n=1 Tax=Almyronema epifaneia S1 TaxID=2991925 RepID=A0ABW6IJD1_9CYAN